MFYYLFTVMKHERLEIQSWRMQSDQIKKFTGWNYKIRGKFSGFDTAMKMLNKSLEILETKLPLLIEKLKPVSEKQYKSSMAVYILNSHQVQTILILI